MESYKINTNVIASGSKGNCEIYGNVAIDIGIPFSKIKPYINDFNLLLLSHLHLDHININTIEKLAFEKPSLRFGMGEWMFDKVSKVVREKNIDVYDFNKWYNYGKFKVSIGQLYHDIPNAFFRLDIGGYKIFRATDSAHLKGVSAKNYDLYAIEFNHDEIEIQNTINEKLDRGDFSYEINARKVHLSNQQANEFFRQNRADHSEVIRLHESNTGL